MLGLLQTAKLDRCGLPIRVNLIELFARCYKTGEALKADERILIGNPCFLREWISFSQIFT